MILEVQPNDSMILCSNRKAIIALVLLQGGSKGLGQGRANVAEVLWGH